MIKYNTNTIGVPIPRFRYGISYDQSNQDYWDLVRASTWFIDPANPLGKQFIKLSPRTLPNGVSNTDYEQRVSGDVVFNGSEAWTIGPDSMNTHYGFLSPILSQVPSAGGAGAIQIGVLVNSLLGTIQNVFANDNGTNHYYFTPTAPNSKVYIWINKTLIDVEVGVTPLDKFKAWSLKNNFTLRYQLATPIDTLNSPVRNPIQDQRGTANVTMTNVGWTSADGYRVEPLINDYKGYPVTFANLLGNDGNMIDSNADNRADGWTYSVSNGVSCVDNEVVFLPTAQFGRILKTFSYTPSEIIYGCAFVKSTSASTQLNLTNNVNYGVNKAHSGNGLYEFLSAIYTTTFTNPYNIDIRTVATSGFSNITAKQAYLFNLTTMFPDPNRRPTKEQMDSLVKDAIARYGYVNERIIKIAWEVFFNLDGSDTFGALNSASAPNPTGSDDFWQLVVFRPDDTVPRYIGLSRNGTNTLEGQYGLISNTTSDKIGYVVNGVQVVTTQSTGTILQYILFGRINGRRFAIRNAIEIDEQVYADLITSRPNTQLGCRSNSVDGATKSAFSKGLQGVCAMGVGPQGSIDKAKLVATASKAMKQIYGLGA